MVGNFTYEADPHPEYNDYLTPHLAHFKGTSEVWEYYKTPSGTGQRRSVSKKNVSLTFNITTEGYCSGVYDEILGQPILFMIYEETDRTKVEAIVVQTYDGVSSLNAVTYSPIKDAYGNIVSFDAEDYGLESYFRINYDYSKPAGSKTFNYIPSQNLISQEYSLCEVMQWIAPGTHQRKSAGGTFKVNGKWVTQDQIYNNFTFDAYGNETSLTYGDNILQKTTWDVQP